MALRRRHVQHAAARRVLQPDPVVARQPLGRLGLACRHGEVAPRRDQQAHAHGVQRQLRAGAHAAAGRVEHHRELQVVQAVGRVARRVGRAEDERGQQRPDLLRDPGHQGLIGRTPPAREALRHMGQPRGLSRSERAARLPRPQHELEQGAKRQRAEAIGGALHFAWRSHILRREIERAVARRVAAKSDGARGAPALHQLRGTRGLRRPEATGTLPQALVGSRGEGGPSRATSASGSGRSFAQNRQRSGLPSFARRTSTSSACWSLRPQLAQVSSTRFATPPPVSSSRSCTPAPCRPGT